MGNDFDSADFLVKLKKRDPVALELLVKTLTRPIFNASIGLGFSPPEADDLTQSVWLTFFDAIQNFEGRSKIKTFLFGILYNKASELRKRNGKTDSTLDIEAVVDAHFDNHGHWAKPPIDPEAFFHSTQVMGLIQKCLEALPLSQKMAFSLKEIEEESTDEICHILAVTATNLGVLLFRARNQLRECIEHKSK